MPVALGLWCFVWSDSQKWWFWNRETKSLDYHNKFLKFVAINVGCDVRKQHSQSEVRAVCIHQGLLVLMKLPKIKICHVHLEKCTMCSQGHFTAMLPKVHHMLSRPLHSHVARRAWVTREYCWIGTHTVFALLFSVFSREWVNVWNQEVKIQNAALSFMPPSAMINAGPYSGI